MSVTSTILPCTVDTYWANINGGPVAPGNTGIITSLYGPRQPFQDPDTGIWTGGFHTGLDVAYAPWTSGSVPLVALFAGTVDALSYNPNSAGHAIRVRGDDGSTYFEYFHMSGPPLVSLGQRICAGMVIGYIGNTGLSTGPHLHLGVFVAWQYVDPMYFLLAHREVGELILGSQYFDEYGHYHDEYGNWA